MGFGDGVASVLEASITLERFVVHDARVGVHVAGGGTMDLRQAGSNDS